MNPLSKLGAVAVTNVFLACTALAPAYASPGLAAAYPDKPLRLVVPYPPGGSNDLVARIIAQKLSESWGQRVFVDNRAGANGVIGT